MALQLIDHGSVAGDGLGEDLFDAFTKVNANFTELYAGLGGLVAKSGTAVQLLGSVTTSETALATIVIPANALGSAGALRVTTTWSMTTSGNAKEGRLRLGSTGLGGTSIALVSATTITSARMDSLTRALNATNSQNTISMYPRGTDLLVTQNAGSASTIDMTAAQNLVISGKCANSADTLTLLGYVVEIVK